MLKVFCNVIYRYMRNKKKGDVMKVTIEIDENLSEECVVIKCRELSDKVVELQKTLMEKADSDMTMMFYKDGKQYYIAISKILFFETENKVIMVHTKDEIYESDYKLYELEKMLPRYFMRISKSGIVNINHIYYYKKYYFSKCY